MAQPCKEPITLADIAEYRDQYSDFAFELSVARNIKDYDIDIISQSGIYTDPNTGLNREFDIRAKRTIIPDKPNALRGCALFSIECKNIKDYSPIVVHCIKRDNTMAYQNAIFNPSPSFLVTM